MLEAFKDGLGLALIGLGFVAGMIVDAALYIWRKSVPEGEKADEQHAASIEHFPMNYVTFVVALVGVIGCAAIVAWGL